MKRIHISALAVLGVAAITLSAPKAEAQCLNDEHYFEELAKQDPASIKRANQAMEVWKTSQSNPAQSKKQTVYRIPVVFHVIHQYGDENISKEQIEDQIRILNEDFRRMNADASNTRSIFQSVAADCEIEFVLAKRDPNGNCTEGIVRVYSPLTVNARDDVKAVSYWPSDKYLNIWVVKSIKNSLNDPGVITLGYAQFPWDRPSKPTTDGVVVRADYVGSIGTALSTNSAGRTATHEIGHWFGLFHTFQGGCFGQGLAEQIQDTPPVKSASSGCPLGANTCNNDNPDLPDQVENYMDYSNGTCMNMFTNGQKGKMQSMISAYRSVIVSASNASATGIDLNTSTCKPIADLSSQRIFVCENQPVTLKDLSYNSDPALNTYKWTFEGGTPATSIAQNPSVSFASAGLHNVKLEVSNANGSSSIVRDSLIQVFPNISPSGAPLQENFEFDNFPPLGWENIADGLVSWERYEGAASRGNISARVQISSTTPLHSNPQLRIEPLDMIAISDPVLTFDLAYAQLTSTSIDRLRVYTSTDCGVTWVLIYQRAGSQMNTGTVGQTNFVPTSNQWSTYSVNLKNYVGKRNLILRFDAYSDQGGNIYLDNINVGSLSSVQKPFNESTAKLYPNPANNESTLSLETYDAGNCTVQVYDASGKLQTVGFEGQLEAGFHELPLKTADLPAGIYMITTTLNGVRMVNKLVVTH
ncbi:MAG: T9SS type A sorting domain-containing protein [Bacteroidetes bacterium]|nr:T9SS type A sorting domain-containing protein [Bacteroidota bacterium]